MRLDLRFAAALLVVVHAGIGDARAAASAPRRHGAARTLAGIAAWIALPGSKRSIDAAALSSPLDRRTAERALEMLTADRLAQVASERRGDLAAKRIAIGDKALRWEQKIFGQASAGRRSLWISLHGGGNAPPALNDGQWRNQIGLYEPPEGVYVAPRAPTDTWNLWHEEHIDPLLQALIDAQVAANGVDPNRVYLMGYSAGGDGVWQLAPRMADRFAAAAMMAGHPGDASLLPLRNLPFAIFMGGEDGAYDRNAQAVRKAAALDALESADPGGYTHLVRIYPGLPHWMNRRDAEALPWMARFTRDPWPGRVVWVQDDVPEDRFYWLELPAGHAARPGERIEATVRGQHVVLDGDVPDGTILRLSDRLLDLDRPVTVAVNGRLRYRGVVPRTAGAIQRSLLERADSAAAATALLRLPGSGA